MHPPIDLNRLELLKQQQAQTSATLSRLFVALAPLRAQMDVLSDQLKLADNSWKNATFDATAAGEPAPARPAAITKIMAEIAELDHQLVLLDEEKNSLREASDQLTLLITSCTKFVEKVQ